MTHIAAPNDYIIQLTEDIRQANQHNPIQPLTSPLTCNEGAEWAQVKIPIKRGHNPRFYGPKGWEIRYIDIEETCIKIELYRIK